MVCGRSESVDKYRAIRVQPQPYRHQQYAADLFAPGPERPGGRCQKFHRLFPRAQERQGPLRTAFVCGGWTRLWAAAHEVSRYGMASVGGEVARNNRDDLAVSVPDSHENDS